MSGDTSTTPGSKLFNLFDKRLNLRELCVFFKYKTHILHLII